MITLLGLNPTTSVLIRDRRGDTQTQRESSVKTGQRRVAQPHDGEHLESAEAGRVKTLSPLEPSEVVLTILAPRTV